MATPNTDGKQLLQVWIDDELHARLHAVARRETSSASAFARRPLIREIELQEMASVLAAGRMIAEEMSG
jgi:predicted transcriptional regulator